MQGNAARQLQSAPRLPMPDQNFTLPFSDAAAPRAMSQQYPVLWRRILLAFPLIFAASIIGLLAFAFQRDGVVTLLEFALLSLMAVLAWWDAIPTTNAIIGLTAKENVMLPSHGPALTVAILLTIRDEDANSILPKHVKLLQSLQKTSSHQFALHILSDTSVLTHREEEQRIVALAVPLPVFHHHRNINTDFKSGNIRNWIENRGHDYDAFLILDADSEIDSKTVLALTNELSSDANCALIQTVPIVLPGYTLWQNLQSVASKNYGALQGFGLAAWMGKEANYFGHNAIVRTKAFATCAGLPHLKGAGLWNGTILSHDFVEAALLRRGGWGVKLFPSATGSFEQAPVDSIAHLKRDARWCHGNFQHSRILSAAGLHATSRFHLFSGMFSYLSSLIWCVTLLLWAVFDATQTGVSGAAVTTACLLIFANLLAPRLLGLWHAVRSHSNNMQIWQNIVSVTVETMYSSLMAPALMVQRVLIIGRVVFKQRATWAPQHIAMRNIWDFIVFHVIEFTLGLGLLACIERGLLTVWFLPLAICLILAPLLAWMSAWKIKAE